MDLRDERQALIDPMDPPRKLRLFGTFVRMDFKVIESASRRRRRPSSTSPAYGYCERIGREPAAIRSRILGSRR